MFLSFIDQSKVDNTTEKFLEVLKDNIFYKCWCFGHYHADRVELPYVEQFFTDSEDLNELVKRWEVYSETGYLDYWIPTSPKMKGR